MQIPIDTGTNTVSSEEGQRNRHRDTDTEAEITTKIQHLRWDQQRQHPLGAFAALLTNQAQIARVASASFLHPATMLLRLLMVSVQTGEMDGWRRLGGRAGMARRRVRQR